MIMLHVHRGECRAGATLPMLHIVGDSVSAREVLNIRRRLNLATSTHNQPKQHMGTVPLQQQELSYRGMFQQDDNHTETHILSYMPTLYSSMHATIPTPKKSYGLCDRHKQVNNVTSGFSSALARAFIVASEPAMMMKVRSQLPRHYAIASLDSTDYGQDGGNLNFKFTESQDTSFSELFPVGDTNFAEKNKGQDRNSMFCWARQNFTSGTSADIACLEKFQDFSCLPWTENDRVHCSFDASSTMPCDAFLESSNMQGSQESSGKLESSGSFDSNLCCDSLSNNRWCGYETQARLMPARKKARTI